MLTKAARWWRCCGLVVVIVLGSGCGAVSRTTSTATPGVSVFIPSSSDQSLFQKEMASYNRLPYSCTVTIVPGKLLAATDAVNVSWAYAAFLPTASCTIAPAGDGPKIDPLHYPPFYGPDEPPGFSFEKKLGGSWELNGPTGLPFPCPDPGGAAPGPGVGALPKAILAAWGLTYAAGCNNVQYSFPGH